MTNQINKIFTLLSYLLFSLIISSCTEGDRGFVPIADEPVEEVEADIIITGGAVKGPLVNAEINIYKFELEQGTFNSFNKALSVWFDLLDENDIQVVDDSFILGDIPEVTVVNNLLDSFTNFGYVSELKSLKSELAKTTDFASANTLVNKYITTSESNTAIETNSVVIDEVQKIIDVAATLSQLQSDINNIETLSEKLLKVASFSAASSLLSQYRLQETNTDKLKGFSYAQEKISLLANKASQFGLSGIRNYYTDNTYDVFLNDFSLQGDPVARQNIIELKSQLDSASSVIEAEALLIAKYRKEGNILVKASLAKLISKIITISDVHDLITGYDAIYHDFSLRSTLLSLFSFDPITLEFDRDQNPSFDALFQNVTTAFQNSLEEAFRDSLVVKDDEGEYLNRLSYGISNNKGLLPGLNVGQYRGFIYMEAIATNNTIDLNSGSKPILEKMESIFHTDDILGNGDNSLDDETVYFLLNGEVQRDSDGKLITDKSLIESSASDKLLEVRPTFFATPLTDFAFGLTIEKLKNITNLKGDADQNSLPDNKITESVLKNVLQSSAKITSETFGIGLSDHNIFKSSPVRLAQMQYFQESELEAIQYRLSIENYSSFLYDLMNETNLKGAKLIELLIKDLNDGQIDGLEKKERVEKLSDIQQLDYLLKMDPSERLIPNTIIPVSKTYFLMNQEHSSILSSESLSLFSTRNSDLTIQSPKGGTDSDLDGVLDNDDQFPNDPEKSRNINPDYEGIWSINYNNSETEYMPINEPFVFQLNVEQIEGLCTLDPCIGIGNSSTTVLSSFELISSPVNQDFNKTPLNDSSLIGFTAFATTPGNYLVKAELSTAVDPIQTYTFMIPIHVIDPKSIEIQFDPIEPKPGKTVTTRFKATKAICHLYSICGNIDLNDNEDDFLSIALLSDIFSVNQKIIRNDASLSYSSVTANNLELQTSNLSNIGLNDTVSISIRFKAGERSLIAASYNHVVGNNEDADNDGISDLNDFYPSDSACYLEKDGFQDTNFDGDVNELDSPTCFASKIAQPSEKPNPPPTETFDVSFLNETWIYNPEWHFIIRANKYSSGYNGYIQTPTRQGTKELIEEFLIDPVTKRIYFAYKNGAIDYYSLELQAIKSFAPSYSFTPVTSMHLLGSYLLVEYGSSAEAKLFNSNSKLAEIGADVSYPYPGNAFTLNIDKQNLISATNNLLDIQWVLERESIELDSKNNHLINEIPIVTTNDGLTLNSGQTVFGDVVKVTLNFTTDENKIISLNKNIFVLGIKSISFESNNFDAGEPLLLLFNGFNSELLSESNRSLFVKWYKDTNANTEGLVFSFSDLNYPFVFEGKNIIREDIIRADLHIQHGENALKITSLEIEILGDLKNISPIIDADISIIDGINRTVSLTLLEPPLYAKYINNPIFQPVWRINGEDVENETELFFPSLASTTFSYGDTISVLYKFDHNGVSSKTNELTVGTFDFNDSLSTFTLDPKAANIGEDISLTANQFAELELITLEAKWRINGVIAKGEELDDEGKVKDFSLFTFPGSKLSYGDRVELLLLLKNTDIDRAFTHIATASVGVNLQSLNNNQLDPENDLDSDNDGIPNHLDYFRNDAQCSLASEGMPDDIDKDGINDLDELKNILKTNPNLSDTDGDGLTDYAEINIHSTDPTIKDSDGDGYLDGVEIDLGSDPNDPSEPDDSLNDNDFDGLSNALELENKTKVNVSDTDKDGLSDWFELNIKDTDPRIEVLGIPIVNTNPLEADSDGDKLSDGVELRVTFTNPNLADTDGDGINDGIEVVLKLDPLSTDTDGDGILDSDELGLDFNVTIPSVLFHDDLINYNSNFSNLLNVEQGTCFKTWLANNKPAFVNSTHNPQLDSTSTQEVAFASDDWNQIIRFDATNKAFADIIELNIYDAKVTSINYDAANSNILYVGFSDGWIRQYNSETKLISEVFNTNRAIAITTIVAHDDFLIAEQIDEDNLIHHSVFKLATPFDETPTSTLISDYNYQNTIWLDDSALSRIELISFDENFSSSSFIKETINPALVNPIVSSELIDLSTPLKSPLFIEQLNSKSILNFANGRSYNLSDNILLTNTITSFDLGFEHQSHRVVSQPNASFLEMTTLSNFAEGKYWSFNAQLINKDLLAVLPVGQHLLAISSTEPSKPYLKDGKIAFQYIVLGDEDGDSLPDWWNNLSESLTVSEYDDYQLTDDALIPDLLDGTPNVDNSLTAPVLVDTDGDQICDHWETSLFNTNPLLRDTDDDGMSDAQELTIVVKGTLDCKDYPTFTIISDPLNPDSDADGLEDGDEAYVYLTKILNPDSDGDGLTDYQEIFITFTDPNNDQENGDGDSDGDNLSDSDELNLYKTDIQKKDSDGDKLDDDKEVLIYGTNPNNPDTDGDGLTDYVEVTFYKTDPTSIDSDTDGVSDVDELNINNTLKFKSDPNDVDSDDDGLTDLFEFTYEYTGDQLNLLGSPKLHINPKDIDTDKDGICDRWEVINFFSNPAEADTDGDGLSDAQELGITLEFPVNCLILPESQPISSHSNQDTDSDGILDADEVLILSTNPRDKDSDDNNVNDDLEDPDNDLLTNYQELYQTFTDPLNSDSNNNGINDGDDDEDNDGLSNIDELNIYGTDPRNHDSDDDGINDKDEVESTSNPKLNDSDDDGLSDNDEIEFYKTDPLRSDTDRDGHSDYVEVTSLRTDPLNPDSDYDFLMDGDDDVPLKFDADGDGIPDGIEVHYLNTDPGVTDSDGDGVDDGYETWVFAYSYDNATKLETNTLLNTGVIDAQKALNSHDETPNWPKFPVKFMDNNLDRRVVDLVDVIDPSFIKGRLYIQRYSNPSNNDSDGDGLFDSTEFEIERVFGVDYNESLSDASFKPAALNADNFKVSNPWSIDSNSGKDSDGDGIPDFYEIKLTKTDPLESDTDNDGIIDSLENEDFDLLNNLEEVRFGSNSLVFEGLLDSDNDGLIDVLENLLFSQTGNIYDPFKADSNNNGIADGDEDIDQDLLTNLEEVKFETDPLTKDFGLDSDSDGLSDYQELLATSTNPFLADSDGNDILDGDEDFDSDGLSNLDELRLGSNPYVANTETNIADTDNDGLTDYQELTFTKTDSNLSNSDSDLDNIFDAAEDLDSDGLTNFQEMKLGTNPLVKDSYQLKRDRDDDGLVDIYEIKLTLSNPDNPDTDDDGTSDFLNNKDGDLYSDFQEVLLGTDPLIANPISFFNLQFKDSDNDGLSDFQETYFTFTDPEDADSDNNGINDGQEDADGDGVSNLSEVLRHSDPQTRDVALDKDKDGLSDIYEAKVTGTDFEEGGADSDGNGINDGDEDPDNDGIPNYLEFKLLTNPAVAEFGLDSDADGLTDYQEINLTLTDPQSDDSDNNGIKDGLEDPDGDLISNLAELKQGSDPFVNNLKIDTDLDGLTDFQEISITKTKHRFKDSDRDGIIDSLEDNDNDKLTNIFEFVLGTNPLVSDMPLDTDGDGLTDYQEITMTMTNHLVKDTDGNGVDDNLEDPDNDRVSHLLEVLRGSDPLTSEISVLPLDSDGDGLSDFHEITITKTNILLKDTNSNGVEDGQEDFDGDRISNLIELIRGSDPLTSEIPIDSDGDGLSDYQELFLTMTNPDLFDTDGDGIPDPFEDDDQDDVINIDELRQGTDPLNDLPLIDSDGDGLTDYQEEKITMTDPLLKDTDGDGVNDDQEDSDKDRVSNLIEVIRGSNPLVPEMPLDSDFDGLTDFQERNITRTKPLSKDSNDNGVEDGLEDSDGDMFTNLFEMTLGTNPFIAELPLDTDGDGITDYQELTLTLTDPLLRDSDNDGVNDNLTDSDEDKVTNLIEVRRGSNPLVSELAELVIDSDGDGLTDYQESLTLTDPLLNDTDNDGVLDGLEDPDNDGISNIDEIRFGSDPLVKYKILDTDKDGLTDYQERRITQTNPNQSDSYKRGVSDKFADSDNDGMPNYIEALLGMNPASSDISQLIIDTDSDGLPDHIEILFGISDPNENSDGDQLTNLQEILFGSDPLTPETIGKTLDSDGDGLSDFIELKLTFTNPLMADSDSNGITDANEDPDRDGLRNYLELMLGTAPSSMNLSLDADGDLLTDIQEEFITLTNPNLSDTDSNGIPDGAEDFDADSFTNIQEIALKNNPFIKDILDADEDADSDYYTNLKEQVNGIETVAIQDKDGDLIYDGIEALLLNTDIDAVDTDGDGLNDQTELKLLNPTDVQAWLVREIEFNEFCSDLELRISSVAGKDYCFTIEYSSYPTLIDSDNDGVADRSVNPSDNSITLDYYPLDASCHLATDGFTKSDGTIQCFSSWMGEGESIDIIEQAEWLDTSNAEPINHADIMFFSSSWNSIVVYNALTGNYGTRIIIKEEINTDPVSLIDFEFSKTDKLLYLLYSDSTIETFNVQTGLVQTLVDQVIIGAPSSLKLLNANKLILETRSAPNSFNFYLLDSMGSRLDDLLDQELALDDSILVCAEANANCNENVSVFGFIKDAADSITNIGRLDIDLLANIFNSVVAKSNILSSENINGPIKLSLDAMFVQIGSGQVVNLLLEGAGTDLSLTHKNKAYDSYFDFVEYADHFVGVVDVDLSNIPGGEDVPNTQNGLIVVELESIKDTIRVKLGVDESINDLKELNQYLLPPQKIEEQVLKLIPFVSNVPLDTDGDGLTDHQEIKLTMTDPLLKDTDGNGTEDAQEDFDGDSVSNLIEVSLGSDPLVSDVPLDTDGDGLTDYQEIKLTKTDPSLKDTDGNGTEDAQEDFDGDSVSNLIEVSRGSDPFAPDLEMSLIKKSNNQIVIDQLGLLDGDADLMTGLYEKIFGLDDNNAADKFLDLDLDGLSNVEEYFFGTDPSNEDSDADGWFDIDEIINGTDPNNSLSF